MQIVIWLSNSWQRFTIERLLSGIAVGSIILEVVHVPVKITGNIVIIRI